MTLFSDSPISRSEDLQQHESGILEVLRTEKIGADAKLSLAQREIALELITFLQRHAPAFLDEERELHHVLVSDGLRQWHETQSLASIYRDAYFRSLNDRHKEKWAQYSRLTKTRRDAYLESGVAVSRNPVYRPGAPVSTGHPGGTAPARTVLVSIALVGAGVRGGSSLPQAVDLQSGELLKVECGPIPDTFDGWLVYAGTDADALPQQTAAPVKTNVWLEPTSGLISWGVQTREQGPDLYVRAGHILRRG